MHIDIAKNYELRYWEKTRDKSYMERSETMWDMFDYPKDAKIVADVGCGPKCGFFHQTMMRYPVMYAVDPLWESYREQNLALDFAFKNLHTITAYADTFKLPEKADFIVSFNALDHSGSLKNSILNIMSNIKSGGSFFLHVHMRTKKQLNKGHKMLFDEHDLRDIFKPFDIVSERIESECPLDRKPYRSYIAQVKQP